MKVSVPKILYTSSIDSKGPFTIYASSKFITSNNNMQEHSLVEKLFGELRQRYARRAGGYTRLLHIPNRTGDNAKMAVIELVDNS